MRILFFLFLTLLIIFRLGAQEIENFYYYENEPIYLKIQENQLAIRFVDEASADQYPNVFRNILGDRYQSSDPLLKQNGRLLRLTDSFSESELTEMIELLQAHKDILIAAPVFKHNRTRLVVNNEFMVRFKSDIKLEEIVAFNNQNKTKIEFLLAEDTYVLSAHKDSKLNGITAANLYHNSNLTEWANPNFTYVNWELLHATVNDPFWNEQWAHKNTGQSVATGAAEGDPSTVNGYPDADMDVDLAWDALVNAGKTAGGSSDILVGIIDSGMDLEHPDLDDNIPNPGQDFTADGTTDDKQGHGTAVSGIIAAEGNNGEGVAGIAYQSKLLPVKFYSLSGSASDDGIAQAIDYAWQQGADVLNNSWGGSAPHQGVTDAINRAKTQGRNGLGCVIFYSSGNEGNGEVNYPAYLEDVIAVGASNMYDEKKNPGSQDYLRRWGGNYGDALDLVAPTTVYTTDVVGPTGGGLPGFKDGDYNDTFSGTSAACPNAAGVAALVLAANSNLSSDHVQDVLQKSADKIELYPYNTSGWNKHVGYGRVNAHKAVSLALNEDGDTPDISFTPLQEITAIESRTIAAGISDESGIASGDAQPRLYYRRVFDNIPGDWNYVIDEDGPSGSTYEFVIPALSWGSEVQYYIAAQDNSTNNRMATFPFGGNGVNPPGTTSPTKVLRYYIGEFDSQIYSSTDVPISWTGFQGHTSSLNISENHSIVDINATIDVSGYIQDFAIDLEGPDKFGAGIAMLNPGESYTNTTFNDEASMPITEGSSPYTGAFQPDNSLVSFDGKNTSGEWTLRVYDDVYYNNGGSINNWNVQVKYLLPVNSPVVTDISNQTIAEGGVFAQISFDGYVSDADNSDLDMTWTADGQSDLIVELNSGTRIATISTPDPDWFGTETIIFTATDPTLLTDSDPVVFEVTPVNDEPVVENIPNKTVAEGTSFAQINLDEYVNDIDNDDNELTWTATGNSNLIVSINNQTRVATITPPNVDWNGNETITFRATDPGQLFASDPATFTITAVNDTPLVGDIPAQTIAEGNNFTNIILDNYVSDVDNSVNEISWDYSGDNELSIQINQSRIAIITAIDTNWNGQETITFSATDPGSLSDTDTVLFKVTPVNDAPQITSSPQTGATQDIEYRYQVVAEDADTGDELSYSITTGPDFISINETSGLITGTPKNADVGLHDVSIKVTDLAGAYDTQNYQINVLNQNDPPIVSSIPDQSIQEGQQFSPINLDEYVLDPDHEDGDMIWTYSRNNELIVNIDENRIATVTLPDQYWNGIETIIFKATDPGGLSDVDSVKFTVFPVNGAPLVDDIPDQIVTEGNAFSPINLDNYVSDYDNTPEELGWTYKYNQELMINIDQNRVATITIPYSEWNGVENILFISTDPGGLNDSDYVAFRVKGSNDPPEFVAELPLISFKEDDSLFYPTSNWYAFVDDPDDEDENLSFKIDDEDQKVSADEREGGFSLKVSKDWFGKDTLKLIVADYEYSDTALFMIDVFPVNDSPIIVNTPDSISFGNESGYDLNLSVLEKDIDTPKNLLNWSFSVSDTSLKFEYQSAVKSLKLSAPGFVGLVNLYMTLMDDSSATDYDTMLVNVQEGTPIFTDDFLQHPKSYTLFQNFPNPFNPETHIRFAIPASEHVTIEVFNVSGQKMAVLVNSIKPAGYHTIKFNAGRLSSGIYLYKLQTNNFVDVKKFILMK